MLAVDFHGRYSQLVLCSHRVAQTWVGTRWFAVRLDDKYVTHWSLTTNTTETYLCNVLLLRHEGDRC